VPEVVDPSPIIERRLAELAAEHVPSIKAIQDALAVAPSEAKPALKTELRRARRAYASARREVEKPGVPPSPGSATSVTNSCGR
jgi:hypothetical protein